MQADHLVQPSAAVRLQLEGPIFELVEDWRRGQPKIPSRSEAIRELIKLALDRVLPAIQPATGDDGARAQL